MLTIPSTYISLKATAHNDLFLSAATFTVTTQNALKISEDFTENDLATESERTMILELSNK